MERLKTTLIALTMLFTSHVASNAQGRVVSDPWSTAAVGVNTVAIEKMEGEQNKQLDSIKARKNKIAAYTASMETIKELYKLSMQNIRGFGDESVYYVQMAEEFGKIPVNTARALKAINHSPFMNYINSLDCILNIQLHSINLIGTFVDIVNNGKVSLTDFTSKSKDDKLSQLLKDAHIGKGDGYNFLDRLERVTLANNLLYELKSLNYQLEKIVYISKICGLADMLRNLDPESWLNVLAMKGIVEYAVWQWDYNPLI